MPYSTLFRRREKQVRLRMKGKWGELAANHTFGKKSNEKKVGEDAPVTMTEDRQGSLGG